MILNLFYNVETKVFNDKLLNILKSRRSNIVLAADSSTDSLKEAFNILLEFKKKG